MKRTIIALALATAFLSSTAQAGRWTTPPAAEWAEEYDTKKDVQSDLKENKSAIKSWWQGVRDWKNNAIKEARKADDIERAKELKKARKAANKAKKAARKEAKKTAKDLKSGLGGGGAANTRGGLSL